VVVFKNSTFSNSNNRISIEQLELVREEHSIHASDNALHRPMREATLRVPR